MHRKEILEGRVRVKIAIGRYSIGAGRTKKWTPMCAVKESYSTLANICGPTTDGNDGQTRITTIAAGLPGLFFLL